MRLIPVMTWGTFGITSSLAGAPNWFLGVSAIPFLAIAFLEVVMQDEQ